MKLAPLVPTPKPSARPKVQRTPNPTAVAPAVDEHPDDETLESDRDSPLEHTSDSLSAPSTDFGLRMRAPRMRLAARGRETESETVAGRIAALSVAPDRSTIFGPVPLRRLLAEGILPKLEIGDANDPLEHEADAIADRIMRMPAPSMADPLAPSRESNRADAELRRACCSSCSSCDTDEDDELRREPGAGQRGGTASEDFSASVRSRASVGGWPLSMQARDFLEPRLGVELRDVRTHADAHAGALTQRVRARAFTLGQDIFFAPGELRPHTAAGMRLLAHEVAHTLQNAGPTKLHRTPEAAVRRTLEGESETTEALEAVDYGEDLSTQSKQLRTLVALLRDNLLDLIGDLMRPTRVYDDENVVETFPSELAQFRVPAQMREDAEAASSRFIKITEYLDGQSDRSAVLMSQWLDAAAELIAALQTCVRWIRENGGEIGNLLGATHHRRLAVLEARAHKLMATAFFSKGADLEIVARGAEEAAYLSAAKQTLETQLAQQLSYLRQETEADWRVASESQLRAELGKLRVELEPKRANVVFGDAEARAIAQWEVRVLETKIEVIGRLADELDFEPGPESPSVTVGRWWKMTRGGQNAERLAQLALPYARRGTNHDLWVVETVLEWLWLSKDDAADFSRYFVEGLGSERAEIFVHMKETQHGVGILMALRMNIDRDLVFGTGAEQLWGHFTGDPTTEEINAGISSSITESLGDEFSEEELRARLVAGEEPSLRLTLGALSTRIDATVVNDRVRLTAGYDVAREVGVPDLIGTGLYLAPDAIIQLYYKNTHKLTMTTAAHLGAVVKGELDKSLPWNVSTDAIVESLIDLAAAQIKKAEGVLVPAIWYFADNLVPEAFRSEAQAVAAVAEASLKGFFRIVMFIAGLGIGLTKAAVDIIIGLVQLAGIILDIVNALVSVDDPRTLWPLVVEGLKAVPRMVDEAVTKWGEKFIQADEYEAAGMIGLLVAKVIQAIVEAMEMVHFVKQGAKLVFGGFKKDARAAKRVAEAREHARGPDGQGQGTSHADDADSHGASDGSSAAIDEATHAVRMDSALKGIEVRIDMNVPRGEARVRYELNWDGTVDASSVHIVAGPDTPPHWIELHAPTVTRLKKYSGFQGKIRKFLAKIESTLTQRDVSIGSSRWEAYGDVTKIDGMMKSRMNDLALTKPGSPEAKAIAEDIEDLYVQFGQWDDVASGRTSVKDARGFIAARKEKKPNPNKRGAKSEEPAAAEPQIGKREREAAAEAAEREARGKAKAKKKPEPPATYEGLAKAWGELYPSRADEVEELIRAIGRRGNGADADSAFKACLRHLQSLSHHAKAGRVRLDDGLIAQMKILDTGNPQNVSGVEAELRIAVDILGSNVIKPRGKYYFAVKKNSAMPAGGDLKGVHEFDGMWETADGRVFGVEAKNNVQTFANKLSTSPQFEDQIDWCASDGSRRLEIRCMSRAGMDRLFADKYWDSFVRVMGRHEEASARFTMVVDNVELSYARLLDMRARYKALPSPSEQRLQEFLRDELG